MKTYKVHVVYGSREDIQALADILARHEIAFSFSGEYANTSTGAIPSTSSSRNTSRSK
ncbi:MAG: hypothetical protein IJ584_13865 [Bacteroidales bacterium]|nr:hypothetical protein [Bacteroidales bacterium]